MKKNLTIIGAGNMGETMATSLLDSNQYKPKSITLVDRQAKRLAQLQKQLSVNVETNIVTAVVNSSIIILAVKPQDCAVLLEKISPHIKKTSLVISIMAGVPLSTLREHLQHTRIIRSMPNTPAKIQEGMTAWIALPQVTAAQKKSAQQIFTSFGKQLEVKNENLIDAATAVSGSGPAYLFAFAEYLINGGQKLGLSKKDSTILVKQTLRGAALLLDESTEDASTLREQVTSKKGTTDAALRIFKSERLSSSLAKALRAAYRRSKELSRLFKIKI